jgi:mannosyltransferase OCH1-like enzyme
MIPRTLHLIWVGDPTRRPSRCIQSWIDHHPDWTLKVWGNEELGARAWINADHMRAMSAREWNGVADMMRWEILLDEGGVLVDADSFCDRALPDWILECEAFACWENELARPGLIAAGYFGSIPGTPFLARLVEDIRLKPTVVDRMAWETVGPLHLTETWKKAQYGNLTILPSHFFIPRHFTGLLYTGGGPVFARQEWGSTLHTYDRLSAEAEPREHPGQAFLHAPDWSGAGWVEILLSYLEAFAPGEPVVLALLVEPGTDPAEAEAAVVEILRATGRDHVPDVMILDRAEDLPGLLRKHPLASWVPGDPRDAAGLRGAFGARLAQARLRMIVPATARP